MYKNSKFQIPYQNQIHTAIFNARRQTVFHFDGNNFQSTYSTKKDAQGMQKKNSLEIIMQMQFVCGKILCTCDWISMIFFPLVSAIITPFIAVAFLLEALFFSVYVPVSRWNTALTTIMYIGGVDCWCWCYFHR